MNFAEYNATDAPTFTMETIVKRQQEALGTKRGPREFQWLAGKMFPMFAGKSIDAAYLVALFLLTFTLRVMQDRENAGVVPQ
jgi:hypothetical protein